MKLYHGTSEKNAKQILLEGFKKPPGRDKGIHFTTNFEDAKEYGEVILVCEIKDMEQVFFFDEELIKTLKPKKIWGRK